MKKQIFTLIAMLWILYANANVYVPVTFSLDDFQISIEKLNGSYYTIIKSGKYDVLKEACAPELPFQQVKISVPYNAQNITLSVNTNGWRTVGYGPQLKQTKSVGIGDNFNDIIEISDKVTSGKYPLVNAEIVSEVFINGGYKIVTVNVYPFIANFDNYTLQFYPSVILDLSWRLDNNLQNKDFIPLSANRSDFSKITDQVINPSDVMQNAYRGAIELTPNQDDSEYIIICPTRLQRSLQRLAAFRKLKGYTTGVYTIESILNDEKFAFGDVVSSVNDAAGRMRAFLRWAFESKGTRHVLLAGKYPELPFRYAFFSQRSINYNIPTDRYFSDLTSNWDIDKNKIFGEHNTKLSNDINVGRIPFTTPDEVNAYIDKLLIYELNPGNGDASYLSKSLMTRQDDLLWYFYDNDISNYLNTYTNNLLDLTEVSNKPKGTDVINTINNNPVGCLNLIGHGHPGAISTSRSGDVDAGIFALNGQNYYMQNESGNGLDDLNNRFYPSWCFSIACSTMPFDVYQEYNVKQNFGESYVLQDSKGGVAMFGNTRNSWTDDGADFMQSFFKQLEEMYSKQEICTKGVTAGELLSNTVFNTNASLGEKYRHNLFGDPLVNIYTKAPQSLDFYHKADTSMDQIITEFYNCTDDTAILAVQPLDNISTTRGVEMSWNDLNNFEYDLNTIYCVYSKNNIPVTLPVYVQNLTMLDLPSYIFCGDFNCGKMVVPFKNEGNVVFGESIKTIIECLGSLKLSTGTNFIPGCNLEFIVDKNAYLNDITIPNGVTMKITADKINLGDNVVFEEGANVILVERNSACQLKMMNIKDDEYNSAIVEGRSWWYYSSSAGQINHYDYEITIGPAVDVDGIEWHELLGGLYSEATDGAPATYKKGDCKLALIREDKGRIYLRVNETPEIERSFESYTDIPYMYMFLPCMPLFNDENVHEVEVCAFDTQGSTHLFGHDNQNYEYEIAQVSYEEINGHSIKVFYPTWNDQRMQMFATHGRYAERIGWLNELFFLPFGSYPSPSYPYPSTPELRYVTDPDGSIIYEGIGGYKLWDEYEHNSGINLFTSNQSSEIKWFNLQGIEVDKPVYGNIYIRKNGACCEKVIYKLHN